MPGRFELKPTLAKIWQAPDNFRIMDPLPPLHRRGIIIGALMVIVGFLLPSGGDDVDTAPVTRNAQLDLQSQTRPQPDAQPMQTQLVTPSNDPGQVAPVEPEPIQDEQPQEQAAAPSQPQTQQPTGIEQQWRSYRVEPGKTLSNLQNGQMVQIRQNASGVVTGLTIDTGNGQQVLFTRQTDGSFIRVR